MKVVIMSGVSGSGKSTFAHKLGEKHTQENGMDRDVGIEYDVVSADHYFYNADDEYVFDPSKLGDAHANCFREFIERCQHPSDVGLLIVDNTNCSVEEIAPYVLGAAAFGHDCEIITLMPTLAQLKLCHARNTHNVPLVVIEAQYYKLKNRKLPPHWKNTIVEVKL